MRWTCSVALSMIHPMFYSKNGESFAETVNWRRDGNFTAGITDTSRCQSDDIGFGECKFNEKPSIRGKCQADHLWPHALGGPSILDNRVILCQFHNSIKGSGITHFKWTCTPIWLEGYLSQINRLKR